jgi:hypothetical protein
VKRVNRALAAIVAALIAAACSPFDGDWLGPVERGLRSGVNGWDMWATEAVRPYEDPQPERVEGTVPVGGGYSFATGARELAALGKDSREARAALSYRRYCHHCHGQNGDGRIIVGESMEHPPTDLRTEDVQSLTDEELFELLAEGGGVMIPFRETMSPLEVLLTIEHMRTLKNRPSRPFFEPQFTEPIR